MFKQVLRLSKSYNLRPIGKRTTRKVIAICPKVIQNTQAFSTVTAAKKWDLYSAVCLERHPIIIQPMQDIELKFHNILKKIEFENSLKCDHELKAEKEKEQKSVTIDDDDDNVVLIQTKQDFEDSCKAELDNFKFAPTITKFDKENITSSLKRKLDKHLLLLIQQKVGDTNYWIPPQGIRKEGETMRQTAERILQDACGAKIRVKFYGNAPIGFYKYKYPKNLNDQGSYGAKIFYFLAKYIDGDIISDVKYQWLDHEELEKVLPDKMRKSISQFMLFT